MANTVTVTPLMNTDHRRIITVYIAGDGTGEETDTVVYDYSADTNAGVLGKSRVRRIMWANDAYDLQIDFAGATNYVVTHLNQNDNGDFKFDWMGGIPDLSATPTGDVTITTVGLGAGDHGWFMLELIK